MGKLIVTGFRKLKIAYPQCDNCHFCVFVNNPINRPNEVEPTWFVRRAMFSLFTGVLALNVAVGVHSASEALIQQSYIISRVVVRISVIKGARNFWPRSCDKKKHSFKRSKSKKNFFDLCGCLRLLYPHDRM